MESVDLVSFFDWLPLTLKSTQAHANGPKPSETYLAFWGEDVCWKMKNVVLEEKKVMWIGGP